jgi:signal transduction histidine kinase
MMLQSLQRGWHGLCQHFVTKKPSSAEGAIVLQSDLVSRLSHEMRTSLTGIVGYAEFIEAGAEPAMVNFTAKIIRESSQELARSVQSFIDLYQVMLVPSHLRCTEFVAAKEVHALIQKYQAQAHQLDVSLIFNCSDDALSVTLRSDLDRFTKMLEALLGGALASATRGAVLVVALSLRSEQQAIELAIYEVGGADKSAQSKLLQHFWSEPHYVYKMQEGPGVDMALAKALLISLKGQAEFKSVKGQGDQLRLFLPLYLSVSE